MAGFPKAPAPKGQDGTPFTPPLAAPLVMEQFQGLFTSTSRVGVKEEQCWWIDGLIPIGPQMLRTLPGVGPILWTIPASTISFFGFANIAGTPYSIVIAADGSIYAVNTSTGGSSQIAGAGTILSPSRQNVGISQFGSSYVIIVAKQTNRQRPGALSQPLLVGRRLRPIRVGCGSRTDRRSSSLHPALWLISRPAQAAEISPRPTVFFGWPTSNFSKRTGSCT